MILNVAVARDVLEDILEPRGNSRAQTTRATAIAQRLKATSNLLFDGSDSRAHLLARTQSLAPPASAVWIELIQPNSPFARIAKAGRSLDENIDGPTLHAWHGQADVVIVRRWLAELLEEDPDLPDAPELSSLLDVANTGTMSTIEERRQKPVPARTTREALWDERFKSLSETSRDVHIVDQFVGEQVAESVLEYDDEAARGATWFLSKLSKSSVKRVRVVTRLPYVRQKSASLRREPDEVYEAFRVIADRTGLGNRLRTYVVRDRRDDRFPHERHLIFDRRLAFTPHNGLASFDRAHFATAFSCTASAAAAPLMVILFDEWAAKAE